MFFDIDGWHPAPVTSQKPIEREADGRTSESHAEKVAERGAAETHPTPAARTQQRMTLHVKSPISRTKAEYEGCAAWYPRGVSSHHVLVRAFGDAYMRRENERHATLLFRAGGVNVQVMAWRNEERMSLDADGKPVRITLKDAYEELWRCRDFELSHFWQRSVFLGTFLLAAFAAYGALALDWMGKGLSNRPVVNCFCFGLSVVGILLSFLWIMMAKGSKAWYERYEKAICHFVDIASVDARDGKCGLFEKGAEKVVAFAYGKGFKKYSDPVSSWLFNTKGGSYSPSKINIALGHLSLLIWLFLSVVHIAVAKGLKVAAVSEKIDIPCLMIMVLTFGLLPFWLYSKQFLKSTILEETNEK